MRSIQARLSALERKQQEVSGIAAKLHLLDSQDEDTRQRAAADIVAYVHSKVPDATNKKYEPIPILITGMDMNEI